MYSFLGATEIVVETSCFKTTINWSNYFPIDVVKRIELKFSTGAKWKVNIPSCGISSGEQLLMLVERFFGDIAQDIEQVKFVVDSEFLNENFKYILDKIS